MRRTVISFLVALFLIPVAELGLNVQINQSITFSNSFGNENALERLSLEKNLFVSQEISLRMWGMINPFFYVFGEIRNTNFDNFVLEYIPWNLKFGTLDAEMSPHSSISIIGISSQYFSLGQIRGSEKILNFTVTQLNQSFLLSNVAYGSIKVYLNGVLLEPSQYILNYQSGILRIPTALPYDVVTVEYQSLKNTYPTYIFTTHTKFNTKVGDVNLGFTTVSSIASPTDTNQYFAFSSFKSGDMVVSNWFDFENAPTCKMNLLKHLTLFGMKSKVTLSLTEKNFREPLGLPQREQIAFDLSSRNRAGSFNFFSDLEKMNISLKTKFANAFFEVGRKRNLLLRFSSKHVFAGFNVENGKISAFQGISEGPFSAFFEQNPFLSKYNAHIRISTPIEFEASVTSANVEMRFSKKLKNISVSSRYRLYHAEEKLEGEFYLTLKGNSSPSSEWRITAGSTGEKAYLESFARFSTTLGDFSTTFSASHLIFTWSNEETSMDVEIQKELTKVDLKFEKEFDAWKAVIQFSAGMYEGEIGGAVELRIWRNEF